jgi:hypothetical protein
MTPVTFTKDQEAIVFAIEEKGDTIELVPVHFGQKVFSRTRNGQAISMESAK